MATVHKMFMDFEFGPGRQKPTAPEDDPDFVVFCVPGTFATRSDTDTDWFQGGSYELSGTDKLEASKSDELEGPDAAADLVDQLEKHGIVDMMSSLYTRRGDGSDWPEKKPIRIRVETLNWFYPPSEILSKIGDVIWGPDLSKAERDSCSTREELNLLIAKKREEKRDANLRRVGGGATYFHRERGAKALERRLRYWAGKRKKPCMMVAHSHGGNIAYRSLRRLCRWPWGRSHHKVKSIITVGSPLYHHGYRPWKESAFGAAFMPTDLGIWTASAAAAVSVMVLSGNGLAPGFTILNAFLGLGFVSALIFTSRWLLSCLAGAIAEFRLAKDIKCTNVSAPQDEVASVFPELLNAELRGRIRRILVVAKLAAELRDAVPTLRNSALLGIALVLGASSSWLDNMGFLSPLSSFVDERPLNTFLAVIAAGLIPYLINRFTNDQSGYRTAVSQLVYGATSRSLSKNDLALPLKAGRVIKETLPPEIARLIELRVAGAAASFGAEVSSAVKAIQDNGLQGLPQAKEKMQSLMGSEGLFHNAYFRSAGFRFYLTTLVAKSLDLDVGLCPNPSGDERRAFTSKLLGIKIDKYHVNANWCGVQAALLDIDASVTSAIVAASPEAAITAAENVIDELSKMDVASWRSESLEGQNVISPCNRRATKATLQERG